MFLIFSPHQTYGRTDKQYFYAPSNQLHKVILTRVFAGEIHEIGASGISSLKGHSNRRNKCLNDFISLYGSMPLISTNGKAVDSRHEWFW